MPHARESDPSIIRDYALVLLRRKWIVLLCVVVAAGIGVGLAMRKSIQYEGSAAVVLGRQNVAATLNGSPQQSAQPGDRQRIAQTEANLAHSLAVARKVLASENIPGSPVEFLARSSVAPASDADLLVFHVRDEARKRANNLSLAFATAYIDYRRGLDTASLTSLARRLEQRVAHLGATGPQRTLYAQLVGKQQQLETLIALQTANATVMPSAAQAAKVQPKPVTSMLAGAVLGLISGLLLAFGWEALDTRIRDLDEIETVFQQPALAVVPRYKAARAPNVAAVNGAELPALLADPESQVAEAFRMLRASLMFALPPEPTSVLITSATAAEGKSTVAANVAVALARSGKQVILVDADVRRPDLARRFGRAPAPGLTEVAMGVVALNEALISVSLENDEAVHDASVNGNLTLLPAGGVPRRAGEFFSADAVKQTMRELSLRADIVLYDTAPVMQVNDTIVLGGLVDFHLLVVRADMARRGALQALAKRSISLPSQSLGVVVNFGEHLQGYGYGDYTYDYSPAARA